MENNSIVNVCRFSKLNFFNQQQCWWLKTNKLESFVERKEEKVGSEQIFRWTNSDNKKNNINGFSICYSVWYVQRILHVLWTMAGAGVFYLFGIFQENKRVWREKTIRSCLKNMFHQYQARKKHGIELAW